MVESRVVPKRVFLNWNRPCLAAAVDAIVERFRTGNALDLSDVFLVVPGRRSGRRLLELIVERSTQDHLLLTPPEILTENPLVNFLAGMKTPAAADAFSRMCWLSALRTQPASVQAALTSSTPAPHDLIGWLTLADLLENLHVELSAANVDFADVAAMAKRRGLIGEERRWLALDRIRKDFLAALDAAGLQDDWLVIRQSLNDANSPLVDPPKCIVLIGVVELAPAALSLLRRTPSEVVAFIHAPESESGGFDEFGLLIAEYWNRRRLEMKDEQLTLRDGPADQSHAVLDSLASLEGRFAAEDILICASDRDVTASLCADLERAGAAGRPADGLPITVARPYRLLAGIGDFLAHRSAAALANLLRHPDCTAALAAIASKKRIPWIEPLSTMDDYLNAEMPCRIRFPEEQRITGAEGQSRIDRLLGVLADFLGALLETGPDFRKPLGEWSQPIRDVLLSAYGTKRLDPDVDSDRTILEACDRIRARLLEFHDLPETIDNDATAAEAIAWLLHLLERETIPAPQMPEAVEIVGWLEVRLDDAPVLIVADFNEGCIPQNLNSDPFLPDRLRTELGLTDNRRRLARDAYAVTAVLHSRPHVRFIVGKSNADNDRLIPSRLVFACPLDQLTARIQRFFGPAETDWPMPWKNLPSRTALGQGAAAPSVGKPAERRPATASASRTDSKPTGQFASITHVPTRSQVISKLSVTKFRSYLACPFRFYLSHVLRLQSVSDQVRELDGASFGNLAHEVLRRFGEEEVGNSSDIDRVRRRLDQLLNETAGELYGSNVLSAVRVQIEQLRQRLRVFAAQQANRAAAGWRILRTEHYGDRILCLDREQFLIYGKIDRIDVHESTGEVCVLDYKTGDSASLPENAHRRNGEWIDLQLPLYRFLVDNLEVDRIQLANRPVKTGFILLPKKLSDVQFAEAPWNVDDYESAIQRAEQVARSILRGEFWPPSDKVRIDDFAEICRLTVI